MRVYLMHFCRVIDIMEKVNKKNYIAVCKIGLYTLFNPIYASRTYAHRPLKPTVGILLMPVKSITNLACKISRA